MLHWVTLAIAFILFGMITYRYSDNVLQDILNDLRIIFSDWVAIVTWSVAMLILWGGVHGLVTLVIRLVSDKH